MSELPSKQVQIPRSFLTTGVNYARPISLRLENPCSKKITKGYIAIFVCFVMKTALKLSNLTTLTFLAALRRFIASRGRLKIIYYDNGTKFQGAFNSLHAVYNMLQSSLQLARVLNFMAPEECDWKFILPHSPHFGGLWEVVVKHIVHARNKFLY
jgi:hypothetical protein